MVLVEVVDEAIQDLIGLLAGSGASEPEFADEAVRKIDFDFDKIHVKGGEISLPIRAKHFDGWTREFLAANPNSIVLHLGCGLDNRFGRVDNGQVEWYDLDLPPVIDLRRQFYPDREHYHLIASPVTDLDWTNAVLTKDRPTLIVAEGLLMYLSEADVKRLILRLREVFPGCQLIADVFSRLTARSATKHPSLKQTGAHLGWGIDDPREVEGWAPGIHLIEEWYFSQDPDLVRLSVGYRLAYRLAGSFNLVRRAHRIVHYQL